MHNERKYLCQNFQNYLENCVPDQVEWGIFPIPLNPLMSCSPPWSTGQYEPPPPKGFLSPNILGSSGLGSLSIFNAVCLSEPISWLLKVRKRKYFLTAVRNIISIPYFHSQVLHGDWIFLNKNAAHFYVVLKVLPVQRCLSGNCIHKTLEEFSSLYTTLSEL